VKYSNTGTRFGYGARFKRCLVEVLVHEIDGPRDLRWHDMLSHVMTCDKIKQINKNKISIFSKNVYVNYLNLSSLFAYKNFHQIFMIIFWPDLCFTRFKIASAFWCIYFRRQGPRAQWVVGCCVSHVKCDLKIFVFIVWICLNIFRPSLKKIVGFYQVLFWISDSESGQRLIWSQVWNIYHLFTETEGNSVFCGPETVDVSRGEAEGNIDGLGSTKHTAFPRSQ
jgi:hypothetical protein